MTYDVSELLCSFDSAASMMSFQRLLICLDLFSLVSMVHSPKWQLVCISLIFRGTLYNNRPVLPEHCQCRDDGRDHASADWRTTRSDSRTSSRMILDNLYLLCSNCKPFCDVTPTLSAAR